MGGFGGGEWNGMEVVVAGGLSIVRIAAVKSVRLLEKRKGV